MDDRLAEGVLQVRRGQVQVQPGYDGVYGQVKLLKNEAPSPKASPQLTLF